MKDGRTHLAHKVEHAVDLETGALVAVTVHGADVGDTTSLLATTLTAAEQLAAVQATVPTALVGDRGHHSNDVRPLELRPAQRPGLSRQGKHERGAREHGCGDPRHAGVAEPLHEHPMDARRAAGVGRARLETGKLRSV
jgi:hypothetical protein